MYALLSNYPKSVQSLKDLRKGVASSDKHLRKIPLLKNRRRTKGKRDIKVLLQLLRKKMA